MNKQDHDELLNKGLTQKEIDSLTQKGFTKEEMIQAKEYDKEIKKGFHFMACRYHHLVFTLKQQRLLNHCCFLFFFLFKYIF